MAELSQVSLKDLVIEDIRGSRCRLQRLRDLKFFAGWIKSANLNELVVEIRGEAPLLPSDQFHLEAALDASKISLPCTLSRKELSTCWLEVTGIPTLTSPGQEPRYRANEVSVTVKLGHNFIEADAIDISQSGIGIRSETAIPSLTQVKITAQGRCATVTGIGLVRYCRPDPEDRSYFRIGIQIEFENKLTRALWQRLVLSAMDTSKKAA